MFLIVNAQRMGTDTVAVVIYLGLLVPDTSTGPRKPPLRGLTAGESHLALTQSARHGRCKYCHPPCLQVAVVGKVWESWRSSKSVLYTCIK